MGHTAPLDSHRRVINLFPSEQQTKAMGRATRTRRSLLQAGLALGAATPTLAAPRFADQLDAFAAADRRGPSPAGALLFVGSSTVRYWPDLARAFAPLPVVRRGFGGATMEEVVAARALLFAPHRPAATILYAGENDIAAGASPASVVERFRGLGRYLKETAAGRAPLVFIGLKPSPRRFAQWPRMREVNTAIAALDAAFRPAAMVDTAAFVLGEGGGPRERLFHPDGLHFGAAGYTLLEHAVKTALDHVQR